MKKMKDLNEIDRLTWLLRNCQIPHSDNNSLDGFKAFIEDMSGTQRREFWRKVCQALDNMSVRFPPPHEKQTVHIVRLGVSSQPQSAKVTVRSGNTAPARSKSKFPPNSPIMTKTKKKNMNKIGAFGNKIVLKNYTITCVGLPANIMFKYI
uniref:Uncharacterized protein n=1 Tax=Sphaerodactylus townsendi TaxID=933632 RepID=A0ACB8GC94_9SAUR